MPARLESSMLEDWLENLKTVTFETLANLVVPNRTSLIANKLPRLGGVYAFWWTGDIDLLRNQSNRKWLKYGPGGRPVLIDIDDVWLGLTRGPPFPLYVGKTADSLVKRVGQHLRLKTPRISKPGKRLPDYRPPTTSCQLRDGIEQLFPLAPDSRTIMLENVGLSFVELHSDLHSVNRFYLEDLAIGSLRPPLNVDIER